MLSSKEPKYRPNFSNVPPELAKLKRWALWNAVKDTKRSKPDAEVFSKVPIKITGGNASSTSPEGWGTLEQAQAAYNPQRNAGIMFRLTGNEASALVVDVDLATGHELREAAAASPELAALMKDATLEQSPSGTGVHLWTKAKRPDSVSNKHALTNADGEKVAELEFYGAEDARVITFTGKTYGGTKFSTLKDGSQTFERLARKFIPDKPKTPENANMSHSGDATGNGLSAQEVLNTVHSFAEHGNGNAQKQAKETLLLLAADPAKVHSYPQDGEQGQSSAEQALMNNLAFYTAKDAAVMDAIYRSSKLMRSKWDEKHGREKYGERTIRTAIEGTLNVYRPRTASPVDVKPQQVMNAEQAKARAYIDKLDMSTATYEKVESWARDYLTDDELGMMQDNSAAGKQVDAFLKSVDPKHSAEPASTGFKWLDAELDGGLYPGLYVLGAISSLGKTTLLLQMADQMAAAGHDVMLFSLEMSRYEIIAKSLSRYTFTQARANKDAGEITRAQDAPEQAAMSVRGITDGRRRNGYTDAYGKRWEPYTTYQKMLIEQAGKTYKDGAGGHLYIHESVGTTTPQQVRDEVELFKHNHGHAPIVILDYLQIVAPADPRSTDKQNTDAAVLALKQLSRDEHIPVFTISSFNRANYSQGVSMVAFKESGAIEYSSDVLIGLEFSKQKDIDEMNRNKKPNEPVHVLNVDAEKARTPRLVDAKVLKNRNGKTGGRVSFKYWAQFNMYEDIDPNEDESEQPFIEANYNGLQRRAKAQGYL